MGRAHKLKYGRKILFMQQIPMVIALSQLLRRIIMIVRGSPVIKQNICVVCLRLLNEKTVLFILMLEIINDIGLMSLSMLCRMELEEEVQRSIISEPVVRPDPDPIPVKILGGLELL